MKNYLQNKKTIQSLVASALLGLSALTAQAQCIADFNFTNGAAGTVTFANASFGTTSGTYYYWIFGDGNNGYGASTSNTYASNGNYSVTLLIGDSASGCSDSISKMVTVTNAVGATCQANFVVMVVDSMGNASFNSTSTGTTGSTVYMWNFGDGTSGMGNPISHTFAYYGSYGVTLTITDTASNCNSSYTDSATYSNDSLIVNYCAANASFGVYKDSTLALTWNAYPSFATSTQSVVWTWGDGTTSATFYPTHVYATAGTYAITLTVTDSCGATDTMTINQSIYRLAGASAAITVNVKNPNAGPTAIKSVTKVDAVSLYPNPNNGTFTVNTKVAGTFIIVNELGQTIQSFTTTNNVASVTGLASGMYFLLNTTGNQPIRQKVVVQ